MKKIAILFAILPLIAIMGVAHAQSLGGQKPTAMGAELQNPSIAPDHPLYGLSRAFDKLSMLLTFGPEAKAEKALEHAQQRLADVKAMIEKKRDDLAQKASEEHDELMKEAEENINKIAEKDLTKELAIKTKLESRIAANREKIEVLKTRFKEKGKILEKLRNRTINLEEKITQEKEDLKERIEKAKEGTEKRAAEAIEQAISEIDNAKTNITANMRASDMLASAKEKLESAQDAFDSKNYGMAFGQATAANALAKNAQRIYENVEERENIKERELDGK